MCVSSSTTSNSVSSSSLVDAVNPEPTHDAGQGHDGHCHCQAWSWHYYTYNYCQCSTSGANTNKWLPTSQTSRQHSSGAYSCLPGPRVLLVLFVTATWPTVTHIHHRPLLTRLLITIREWIRFNWQLKFVTTKFIRERHQEVYIPVASSCQRVRWALRDSHKWSWYIQDTWRWDPFFVLQHKHINITHAKYTTNRQQSNTQYMNCARRKIVPRERISLLFFTSRNAWKNTENLSASYLKLYFNYRMQPNVTTANWIKNCHLDKHNATL